MTRPRQETPPRTQRHGRRKGQQLGRTRYRERHGSTGRAGRSKAENRLAGRFCIDDLLGCGSFGQSWHQPHRGGDVKNSVVKRPGDVNPAVWADTRLQVLAEACGWDWGRSASVSVFGSCRCSDGKGKENWLRKGKAPAAMLGLLWREKDDGPPRPLTTEEPWKDDR